MKIVQLKYIPVYKKLTYSNFASLLRKSLFIISFFQIVIKSFLKSKYKVFLFKEDKH